eukprot:13035450-Alexandrium_andersonii.AAC.1
MLCAPSSSKLSGAPPSSSCSAALQIPTELPRAQERSEALRNDAEPPGALLRNERMTRLIVPGEQRKILE